MKSLTRKFPGGYEEWAWQQGEEPVHRIMPPTTMGLESKERPI
jgi:protein-ribulosamine 3-kinase